MLLTFFKAFFSDTLHLVYWVVGILVVVLALYAWFQAEGAKMVKDAIIVLLLVAGITGVYEWGNSRGHTAGYTEGVASQKSTIDGLTLTLNTERAAEANKAAQVQNSASNETIADQTANANSQVVRTQIVDHYHTVEVPVAGACAVDTATITAINALLDTQAVYDDVPVPTLKLSMTLSLPTNEVAYAD
jgi:hypothetical protein